MHANIWRKQDAVPFTADDFLGKGNYADRQRQRVIAEREVAMANAALARIVAGAAPTDDVPDWAREGYGVN